MSQLVETDLQIADQRCHYQSVHWAAVLQQLESLEEGCQAPGGPLRCLHCWALQSRACSEPPEGCCYTAGGVIAASLGCHRGCACKPSEAMLNCILQFRGPHAPYTTLLQFLLPPPIILSAAGMRSPDLRQAATWQLCMT